MTRIKITLLGALAVSTLSLAGCNREGEFSPVDMWNRSRYKPLEPVALGTATLGIAGQAHGASTSRQIPAGTVYRGQIERDKLYPASENGMSVRRMQAAGIMRDEPSTPDNMGAVGDYRVRGGGASMTAFPFPVTKVVLDRGKERFEIYCAPCHGRTGAGDGMVVRRGFSQPPTFHQARLREAPVGHFFDVMTNGYGAMFPYADKVSPEDRWAITAYIRALQLSQGASVEDVPENERANIGQPKPEPTTSGHGASTHGGDPLFDATPSRPDMENRQDPATEN